MKLFLILAFLLNVGPVFAKEKLDIKKYVGLWYELARTPNKHQDNLPTKDGKKAAACINTTATYTVKDDTSLYIKNVCVRELEDKTNYQDIVEGVADIAPDSDGWKLKIAFGPGIAQFFQRLVSGGGFGYWIYDVGPENDKGLYDWAIVSGEKKDFIFLLTREKFISDKVKEEIVNASKTHGLPVEKLIYKQQKE